MSEYFKVYSEYDICGYEMAFKAKDISDVEKFLRKYCESVGFDYDEEIDQGLITIEKISENDLYINLED